MRLASLGRSARSAAGLKVRQPLAALIVELNSPQEREALEMIANQLKDELNVREVRDTSESDSLMAYRLRPNLPALGPKYGRRVNDIRNLLNESEASAVATSVRAGENVQLGDFELNPRRNPSRQHRRRRLRRRIRRNIHRRNLHRDHSRAPRRRLRPRHRPHRPKHAQKRRTGNLRPHPPDHPTPPKAADLAAAIANHTDYITNETLAVDINGEIEDVVARDRHSLDGVEVEIGLAKAF